ncbi:hypothetical protein ACLB2K_007586 [Fragaria x ananassa]
MDDWSSSYILNHSHIYEFVHAPIYCMPTMVYCSELWIRLQIGAVWNTLGVIEPKRLRRRAVDVGDFVGLILGGYTNGWVVLRDSNKGIGANESDIVELEHGVVAADDARCSEIGASILRQGGHAVDAAVATALCLGVVNPMASGIGGGGFMVVRSSATSKTQAFDMRETAPLAASQNMYESNPEAKLTGAMSMGVPGEIAGLHEAWLQHGRMAWKTLFQPAIKLAKEGFEVAPYLGGHIRSCEEMIIKGPGLRQVYAPNGKVLKAGDKCYNVELGNSLESIAEQGPQAFYNGRLGEKIVKDVREAGGILTMEDLRTYKVNVTDAMTADVLGYTISGMPPPSAGTLGLSMGASGIIFLIINGEGVRIRKMFIPGLYHHVTDLLFNVEIAITNKPSKNYTTSNGTNKHISLSNCWEGLRTEPSVKEDEIVLDDSEGVLGTVREDWVLGAPREDWVLDRDGVLSMWLSTAEER